MADTPMLVSEMAARILAIPGGTDPDPVEISLDVDTGLITATDGITTDSYQLGARQGGTFVPTTSDQDVVSAHRWTLSKVTVAGDPDLVAGNIKKDVQIFGVTGSYEAPEPDPVSISVDGSGLITATDGLSTETLQLSTEAGAVITPGTSQKTAIAAQKFSTGAISVAGDPDLVASNIKKDVEIFGVTGSLKTPTVPFTFSVNSTSGQVSANDGVYSSIYNQPTVGGGTFNVLGQVASANQVLADGGKFLTSQVKIVQEPNFLASNIKKGVRMWGTTGSYSPSMEAGGVTGFNTTLTDGTVGFSYSLPSSAESFEGVPSLIAVSTRLSDFSYMGTGKGWTVGSGTYIKIGTSWYYTGVIFYRSTEGGAITATDLENTYIYTGSHIKPPTRETVDGSDCLVLRFGTHATFGDFIPVQTGNYHKAIGYWM